MGLPGTELPCTGQAVRSNKPNALSAPFMVIFIPLPLVTHFERSFGIQSRYFEDCDFHYFWPAPAVGEMKLPPKRVKQEYCEPG